MMFDIYRTVMPNPDVNFHLILTGFIINNIYQIELIFHIIKYIIWPYNTGWRRVRSLAILYSLYCIGCFDDAEIQIPKTDFETDLSYSMALHMEYQFELCW